MQSLTLSIYQWRVLHFLYTNGESYEIYSFKRYNTSDIGANNILSVQIFINLILIVDSIIKITRHGDCSALRHLPALNNKRNYCIHV